MDEGHLTSSLVADLDPSARPVATGYLRELAAALPGSRRDRAAILTEIADGLIEQIANTDGPDPVMVARAAIRAFGNPQHLAAQFARELTGKTAHRTGFGLVSSGPFIGALWLIALTSGPPAVITQSLLERIIGLFAALPVLPGLLLIIVPTALVATAGAGRAARVLPFATGTACLAGLVASVGCAVVDLTLVVHALLPGGAWSPLLIAAITISTVRLVDIEPGQQGHIRCSHRDSMPAHPPLAAAAPRAPPGAAENACLASDHQ